MELLTKLQEDLKTALKGGDSFKIGTIRLLVAALQNEQIAKGKDKELSDEDAQGVLRKEAKKRKESIAIYKEAQRSDLADQEEKELNLIAEYLPAELTDEELGKIVQETVASGEENIGKLIGAVMGKVAGKADSSRVKEAIEKALK